MRPFLASRVKVAIVGPPETGKSVLTNFLGDAMSEPVRGPYRPTKGVRIVETEFEPLTGSKRSGSVTVELWDCSGSEE